MLSIEQIWVFEAEEGATGGFIIAESEGEAHRKLLLTGVKGVAERADIYPITALDLNKSVHILW